MSRIPLPFPRCKHCGKSFESCIHYDCGGKLVIEVNTDEVYCTKCGEHWNIWDSTYYCICGGKFTASEVRSALVEVLAFCKVCAQELEQQYGAKVRRQEIAEESLRSFASSFFHQLGMGFGIAVETLVIAFVKYFRGK